MTMFHKVLVANRGEIALRVIRALRELGIPSVAIHSTADADSLHVRFADESVCIGPPPAARSYLSVPAILSAAEITGADAVHPGYGFLSENAAFADVCQRAGLTFIGPSARHMRLLGDKVQARATLASHGLPVLPGTELLASEEEAIAAAERVGLPVILKATAGGGGRGMKIVHDLRNLPAQLQMARSEAEAAFGNAGIYLERYLEAPRHIEVQILGDGYHALALGERECSIQRRHQKLVEEAPAAVLTTEERADLLGKAGRAAAAIGYTNVGTMEFLMERDAGGRARFSFMEMNTRIQVEHTVTEMVTGVDLVREQIRLAAGLTLEQVCPAALREGHARARGHSIEVRINAEDPETFAPSPGKITALNLPGGPGVRVDTHVYAGYVVPPHYDSLLAKLIVHAEDRQAAIRRLRRALREFVVEGIRTNLDFHRRILDHTDFLSGRLDTRFLERM
jgi:acetyl-CoA carboxylase biotin carboxylase subunit